MKSLHIPAALQFIYNRILKKGYKVQSDWHSEHKYTVFLYTVAGDRDQYWFLLNPDDVPRLM